MAILTNNNSDWRQRFYDLRAESACTLFTMECRYNEALRKIAQEVEQQGLPELTERVREILEGIEEEHRYQED